MNRNALLDYAYQTYRTTPEYLWARYPGYAVLRHDDNNKWYAVIMNVSKDKLGLDRKEEVDIVNVKCDPKMIGSLQMETGILPAYHMSKNSWVSVLLDGSVADDLIYALLDMSFLQTQGKEKKTR